MPLGNGKLGQESGNLGTFFFLDLSHINSVKSNLSALPFPVHRPRDVGEHTPALEFSVPFNHEWLE